MNDATTAFLAFGLTFGGLAFYAWRLDVRGRRLEARLRVLETEGVRKGLRDAPDVAADSQVGKA